MEKEVTFRLDFDDERLWQGDQPIQISHKAFQLLCLLVTNQNRLLTKDFILKEIWSDVFVNEGLIKEYVHDLRSALGDNPKDPRFITTVHGRGYRYLGGIEIVGRSEDVAVRDLARPPSIAVMPFNNISGDPEEEYFADGLSEEIITALSFVPWFFVISHSSCFRYKGLEYDPRTVGEELGVRYLLEGSVRRSGGRLRVLGRLVDTRTSNHIWANRFETELDDMFELQDNITLEVVNAVGPEIHFAEIGRAARKRPTDLNAYDLYLRARAELNRFEIGAAIDLLDQAIGRSPDYAKAKSVRAWCTTLIGWQFAAPSTAQRETALNLAEEALASHEADAETKAYAGYTIGFLSEQAERAISLLEYVVRQCPSFAWALASLALLESYHGDAHEAITLADRSLRLTPRDPQSFRCEMAICKALLVLGKFDECLTIADRGLVKKPANIFLQMCRITCQVQLGLSVEAHAEAAGFRVRNPAFRIRQWQDLTRNWLAWKTTSRVLADSMRSVGIPD